MSQPLDAQFASTAARVESAALRETCIRLGIPQSPQDLASFDPLVELRRRHAAAVIRAMTLDIVNAELKKYRPAPPRLSLREVVTWGAAGALIVLVLFNVPGALGPAFNLVKEVHGERRH